MTPTFLLIFLFTIILQIKTVKNENLKFHDYIFWNENLPLEKRLDDLMMRLTLQEMVDQMANGGGVPDKPAPGIERLGIPPYNFDTECLRGIAGLNSTTFPMPINMAATFRCVNATKKVFFYQLTFKYIINFHIFLQYNKYVYLNIN